MGQNPPMKSSSPPRWLCECVLRVRTHSIARRLLPVLAGRRTLDGGISLPVATCIIIGAGCAFFGPFFFVHDAEFTCFTTESSSRVKPGGALATVILLAKAGPRGVQEERTQALTWSNQHSLIPSETCLTRRRHKMSFLRSPGHSPQDSQYMRLILWYLCTFPPRKSCTCPNQNIPGTALSGKDCTLSTPCYFGISQPVRIAAGEVHA